MSTEKVRARATSKVPEVAMDTPPAFLRIPGTPYPFPNWILGTSPAEVGPESGLCLFPGTGATKVVEEIKALQAKTPKAR